MDKKIAQFEVSSPAELQAALSDQEKLKDARFAAVRVYGPHILTRQFNFPDTSTRDLASGLKLEAAETLSIPASGVEVSYQIISTDEQGTHGVFSAMPRPLLMEYLACFKSHHLVPVSLTASAISVPLDVINNQSFSLGPDYFVVNFLRADAMSVTGFADYMPAVFREAYGLSDADFEGNIRDTIRYACGQSVSKKVNAVLFTGNLAGKEDLIKKIKSLEQDRTEVGEDPAFKPVDFKAPNLLSQYALDEAGRVRSIQFLTIICAAFCLALFLLTGKFLQGHSALESSSRSVNMADYQKALDLQEQLKRMGYVK